jgi:hypothetical protein
MRFFASLAYAKQKIGGHYAHIRLLMPEMSSCSGRNF